MDGQGELRSLAKGRSLLMCSGSAGRGALWGVGSCASSLSSDSSIGLLTVSCSSGARVDGYRILCEISKPRLLVPWSQVAEPRREGPQGRGERQGPASAGKQRPLVGVSFAAEAAPVSAAAAAEGRRGSLLSRCWSVWLIDTAPAWGWAWGPRAGLSGRETPRPCAATSAYRERHLAGGLWGPAVIEVGLTGRRLVHRLRGGGRHLGGRRGRIPDCS